MSDNDPSSVLNSKCIEEVSFVLTGFGKFGNITENPTTTLIRRIVTLMNENDGDGGNNISMCKIIKTAASNITNDLDDIIIHTINLEESISCQRNKHIVFIHLGVDYKANTFKLETTAYNEASFRIPDEDGFQPKKQQIDGSLPIHERLVTDLNVRKICNDMINRGFNVKISGDCGRFVCNYLYWSSLNRIKEFKSNSEAQAMVHSMFVHVPLFTVIDEDTQLKFIQGLLDSIKKEIQTTRKKKTGRQRKANIQEYKT